MTTKKNEIQKKESEDKHYQISKQIAKAGQMSDVKFILENRNQKKIFELEVKFVERALAEILTKNIVLSGVKGEVDNITKYDVMNMIKTKFKTLTPIEVNKAFELDRYSGSPIEHYNLFDSKYVSQILKAYKLWKKNKIVEKNLNNIEPVKKQLTPAQKESYFNENLKLIYKELKENNFCHDLWIYYDKFDFEKKHDRPYKKLLLEKQLKKNMELRQLENPFVKVKRPETGYVYNKCKAILLSNHLIKYTHSFEMFKNQFKKGIKENQN